MSSQLSVAQLQSALSIRKKIEQLEAKINRLHKQFNEIVGGKSVKTKVVVRRKKIKAQRKVRRIKSKRNSLKKLLVTVFTKAGKPLRISEIYKRLKTAGYQTSSRNPEHQLSNRLYSSTDFVRTAPGIFALKSKTGKKA